MKTLVCVVTSNRADYGLLKGLISELGADPNIELELIVTGAHLDPKQGMTKQEILDDKFTISQEIPIFCEHDQSIARSLTKVIDKFDESLGKLRPNYIIVLGDRFEIFGVAIVSHLLRIPIVHIHGGELTEGAIDDAFRHSITKMSSLHFVANESSKNRVIQLGEDPRLIHVVGGLGVDAIKRMKIMPKTEVEKALKFELGSRNVLVTFHPSTTDEISPLAQLNELLAALKELKETSIIFTSPNRDRQVEGFDEAIESFVKYHPNTIFRHSLGNELYISCLAQMDVIVGNSSSGLTEAPSLGVPTLNIGSRQQGRDKAKSVFDCHPDKSSILESLDEIYALRQTSTDHLDSLTYGVGGATSKIMTILRNLDERSFTLKKFFDIPLT